MAFTYRAVSKEEEVAYDLEAILRGHPFFGISPFFRSLWAIDEAREMYLLKIAHSPFSEAERIEFFAFSVNGSVAYFEGEQVFQGDSLSTGTLIWRAPKLWLPKSLEAQRAYVIDNLKQALYEYGNGTYRGSQMKAVELNFE